MTQDKEHIPSLDGVRGFAALAVFLSHMAVRNLVLPGNADFLGVFGVTLFFTLSGFLMSYLYASQRFEITKVYRYVVSRFSRIAPAYLLVIVASYLISQYFDPLFIYQINNANLARHLFFMGNVSVFWSIPPEIQFYVFFIFVWWAIDCFSRKSYWPLIVLTVLCLIMGYYAKQAPGTTLPSKLGFFLLGTCAGLVRYYRPRVTASNALLLFIQIALFLALVLYAFYLLAAARTGSHPYRHISDMIYFSPLYTVICAAVILSLSYASWFTERLFANKPMRLLGAWSFSFYLLHEPFLQIADRLVKSGQMSAWLAVFAALALSLLASYAIHTLVERPAQSAIKKISGRASLITTQMIRTEKA
jgi:peptidoglycan/LPS O-acetylase OafA/YrhL